MIVKSFTKNVIAALVACISVTGCTHYMDHMGLRDEAVYPPAYPIDNPPLPKSNGTIYQSGHEISLYDDRVANRVGDILTVRLEEVTEGKKKTKTKTTKNATNNFAVPQFLGANTNALTLQTNSDQEFNGEGEANEENRLRGTISVTVIRVLSNGNMVVQGESWLTINMGREYVRLTGIVRREDVEPNNSISSQKVADARISYSGNGQTSDVSRGGIVTQFFNKFFPF